MAGHKCYCCCLSHSQRPGIHSPVSESQHPCALPSPLPRAFLAIFCPCEQCRAQLAVGVTCFAVGAVSSPLAHLTGGAMEALQTPALPAALAAVLALPVPRAPPPRLPGTHLTLVPEVAGAAHGPLEKTNRTSCCEPSRTHTQVTASLRELPGSPLCDSQNF